MRKLTFLFLSMLLVFSGCDEYDDSDLKKEIEELAQRLVALETQCKKTNEEIATLQAIMETYNEKDFLTSVKTIEEFGETIGYELTFEKNGTVTIYKGTTTVIVPQISIREDEDGLWYWTIQLGNDSPEWITDEQGNKISMMPTLKIEDGKWWLSTDGGKSWKEVGQATGDKGDSAIPGDSIFKEVTVDEGNNNVVFLLKDGNTITLPLDKFSIVFDEPENMVLLPEIEMKIPYILTGVKPNDIIYIRPVVDHDMGVDAQIIPTDYKSGVLSVYVRHSGYPSPYNVVVVATDNKERSLIRVFTFEQGEIKYIYIDEEGGDKEIEINYDNSYSIEIEESAKAWISISSETTTPQNKILKIFISPNNEIDRGGRIYIVNKTGVIVSYINIHQYGERW